MSAASELAKGLRNQGIEISDLDTFNHNACRVIGVPTWGGIWSITATEEGTLCIHVSDGNAGFGQISNWHVCHESQGGLKIMNAINESDFWERDWPTSYGFDGEMIYVECWRNEIYRMQAVWSPQSGPAHATLKAVQSKLPKAYRRILRMPK